jgi:hypothetical protein
MVEDVQLATEPTIDRTTSNWIRPNGTRFCLENFLLIGPVKRSTSELLGARFIVLASLHLKSLTKRLLETAPLSMWSTWSEGMTINVQIVEFFYRTVRELPLAPG